MGRKANNSSSQRGGGRGRRQDFRRYRSKPCAFCKAKTEYIDWKDTALLRKYMSDRGKIRGRRVNGNCPRHQREVATAIKNAREMALLPYIAGR
ncbi:MAG: 30S ribosomal protein S18 [Acidimicrobiia bacterium]|nr:30S ribosomal protein S18 [Acidimicrobiia bacterium]